MEIKTTDLCDDHSDKIKIAEPVGFMDYGGKKTFYGAIYTIKCFENNPMVRKALEQNGEGKLLVVDGGGSMRCAHFAGIDFNPEEIIYCDEDGIIVSKAVLH